MEIILKGRTVYFGTTFFGFQQRLSDQLKESWLTRRRAPSTCDAVKKDAGEFVASALSDETRSRGIVLIYNPSILLDSDRGILCYLKPGMHLQFAGSGERIVNAVEGDTIRLMGLALDPIKDGYPNQIRIMPSR